MRLDYCKLHTMTGEYGLVSKSFLSISLQCKLFCSTVPLILLMSLVQLGLVFPFSSSNHFKSPFLDKGCLISSYFPLLLFFISTHHHSFSLIPTPTFPLPFVSQSLPQLHIHKPGSTSLFFWTLFPLPQL